MSQPKEYLQAGVMQFTFGSFTGDFFVAAVPGEKKAVAVTGLVADEKNHDASIEDAKRIAACWNAFDGIPTEQFEGKDVTQFMQDQAFLKGMRASDDGSTDMQLHGNACQVIASSFAGQFIGNGGINFLEFNMSHSSIGDFTVTMQKTNGLTPAQLKAQAEKERDEALAALEELLRHFTKTPSTLADSEARGKAHAVIAKLKGGAA